MARPMMLPRSLVGSSLLSLLAVAGCGDNLKAQSDGGGDSASGADAATSVDAPTSSSGVFAIPLATPTGDDQGMLYTASLTASGATFQLDLDSGSTTTGVAAMACTQCTGLSPLYTPGTAATDQHQTASTAYADGSRWSGEIFADTVGLGAGSPDVPVKIVSITSQHTFFFGNEYQGILGLGPDALLETGTTSYYDAVVAAGVTNTMAYELCPTDGVMWLGGYDASHAQGAPQYTPLMTTGVNQDFYAVDMTDMAIGGTSLGYGSSTFDDPIVDTGTSLFYVPTVVETALLAAVNASPGFKALFPNQMLSEHGTGCVMAAAGTTDAMVDAMLPDMSMTFAQGAGSFTISAKASVSYLMNAGGGQYCLVVNGGGDNGDATMGDTILRAFVTIVDVGHGQVGFAPQAHCNVPLIANNVPRGPIRERGRGPHHIRRSR
jgi:hypothetical protein